MDPKRLFSDPIEQEFDDWLSRFKSLEELFFSRHQLYSKLNRQLLEGVIDEYVTIEGPVHVAPTAHIKAGAVLRGPLIVGPDSVIGYGAKMLGEVFVGSGSHVNANAIVSSSLLTKNCTIGENCVVRNTILGCGVVVAPGCLVGDSTKASLEVGTYIGDASVLGLGCIVRSGSTVSRQRHIAPGAVI